MNRNPLCDPKWGFPANVHRIQYDFEARQDDELSVRAGQLVRLFHEYDDGWAVCSLLGSSQKAVVPRFLLSDRCVNPRPAAFAHGPVPRASVLDTLSPAWQYPAPHARCHRDATRLSFLDLPRELRDMIYNHYFDHDKPRRIIAGQWHMEEGEREVDYLMPAYRSWMCEASLVYTCQQVRMETENVLYENPIFEFPSQLYPRPYFTLAPHKLLQALPQQSRKWVQRLEMPCVDQFCPDYSEEGRCRRYLSQLQEWTAAMVFMSQECKITMLTLVAPGKLYRCDAHRHLHASGYNRTRAEMELNGWSMRNAGMKKAWIMPLMLLTSVRKIDIHICLQSTDFLGELRNALEAQTINHPVHNIGDLQQFPKFLQLPATIRNRIYRQITIPPDNNIHPYIRSWYDSDTRNIVPLFLTCRQIHKEAEHVLYRAATFASSIARYDNPFLDFLMSRPANIRKKIRHIRILAQPNLSYDLMKFLADEMPHLRVTYQIPDCWVEGTIRRWRTKGQRWADAWIPLFQRFRYFRMETSALEGPPLQGPYSKFYQSRKWEDEFPLRIHYNVPQSLRF